MCHLRSASRISFRRNNILCYGTNKMIFRKEKRKWTKKIKNLLCEEIEEEILKLSSLEAGSKEKSTAINDLATLYRLKIEETKTEVGI